MIIRSPSQPLLNLNKYDPDPGIYRAVLDKVNRHVGKTGKPSIRFDWKLLSYPDKTNTYFGFCYYPTRNPGFASQMIYSWKGIRWRDLEAREPDGVARPEQFVGEEADVVIIQVGPNRRWKNMDGVWPAGRHVVRQEDGSYSLRPESAEAYERHRQMLALWQEE